MATTQNCPALTAGIATAANCLRNQRHHPVAPAAGSQSVKVDTR